MAANKRKILEAARKHAGKGAKERALKEYEKLLKLDPRDAKLRLEIGDAYRRWGQLDQALATYAKVAEQYMAEGFDARAVAVYKQIQNLDPEHWPSYEPLAELYQRMGLASEAIQTLQTAADGHHKGGRRREALGLLRKMAAIDPSNTTSRLKVADLLRQEKLTDEAIDEYEGVAQELERQGEAEQAASALERVLELDPDRAGTLARLARALLGSGQAGRAEPFARRLLDTQPEEIENYELLAEVYRVQSRVDDLGDVYRRMAELYRRRGDEDRAREITQRFVPPAALSTADADLDDGGLLDDSLQGDLSSFLEDEDFSSEELLDEDLLEPGGPAGGAPHPVSAAEETVFQPAGEEKTTPDEVEPEGDPEQLFAEACVYLRYGKRDQAVRNLEAILSGDAQHRPALEKLGEALAEGGDATGAVEVWMRAAHVAHADGDVAGLDVLRDRIAALDPEAVATLQPSPSDAPDASEEGVDEDLLEVADPVAAPSHEADADAAEDLETGDDLDLDVSDLPGAEADDDLGAELEHDIEIDIDGELDLEGATAQGPPAGVAESLAEPAGVDRPAAAAGSSGHDDEDTTGASDGQVLEDLEEAEFYRQQGMLDEAERIYRNLLRRVPDHPQVLQRLGELRAERGSDDEPTADGAALEIGDVGEETAEATAPEIGGIAEAAPEAAGPEELGDWTEEFGDALAGDDEATGSGIEAGPELSSGEDADGPPATEVLAPTEVTVPDLDPAPAAADDGFDLAAELEDVFDPASTPASESADSFSSIFSEFKKGVSRTLSDSDHEAHYDLGIAYREMGLFADAIGEFRIAMESPTRRQACLHMLGQCCIEAGQPEDATGHLEEALAASGSSVEQQLAVRFDLGRAFAALGDVERARGAWEAVAEIDATFQDVEGHLADLGGEKPDDGATDTVFESFDDVIEEAAAPEASSLESFDDLDSEPTPVEPEPPVLGEAELVEDDATEEPTARPRRKRKKISFV